MASCLSSPAMPAPRPRTRARVRAECDSSRPTRSSSPVPTPSPRPKRARARSRPKAVSSSSRRAAGQALSKSAPPPPDSRKWRFDASLRTAQRACNASEDPANHPDTPFVPTSERDDDEVLPLLPPSSPARYSLECRETLIYTLPDPLGDEPDTPSRRGMARAGATTLGSSPASSPSKSSTNAPPQRSTPNKPSATPRSALRASVKHAMHPSQPAPGATHTPDFTIPCRRASVLDDTRSRCRTQYPPASPSQRLRQAQRHPTESKLLSTVVPETSTEASRSAEFPASDHKVADFQSNTDTSLSKILPNAGLPLLGKKDLFGKEAMTLGTSSFKLTKAPALDGELMKHLSLPATKLPENHDSKTDDAIRRVRGKPLLRARQARLEHKQSEPSHKRTGPNNSDASVVANHSAGGSTLTSIPSSFWDDSLRLPFRLKPVDVATDCVASAVRTTHLPDAHTFESAHELTVAKNERSSARAKTQEALPQKPDPSHSDSSSLLPGPGIAPPSRRSENPGAGKLVLPSLDSDSSDSDDEFALPSFKRRASSPPTARVTPTSTGSFLETIRARAVAEQQARALAKPAEPEATEDLVAKLKAQAVERVAARKAGKPVPVAPFPVVQTSLNDGDLRRSSRARLAPAHKPVTVIQQPAKSVASPFLDRLLAQRQRDRAHGTESSAMDEFSARVLADVEAGRHLEDVSDNPAPRQSKALHVLQQEARSAIRASYARWTQLDASHGSEDAEHQETKGKSETDGPLSDASHNSSGERSSQELRVLLEEVRATKPPKRRRLSVPSSDTEQSEEGSDSNTSFRKRVRRSVHSSYAGDVIKLVQQDAENVSISKDEQADVSIRYRTFFTPHPVQLPTEMPHLPPIIVPSAQKEWDQLRSYASDAMALAAYFELGIVSVDHFKLTDNLDAAGKLARWLLSLSLLAPAPVNTLAATALHALTVSAPSPVQKALAEGAVAALPSALVGLGAASESITFAFPETGNEKSLSTPTSLVTNRGPGLSRPARAARMMQALSAVRDAAAVPLTAATRANLAFFTFRLGMDPFEAPLDRCRSTCQVLMDGCLAGASDTPDDLPASGDEANQVALRVSQYLSQLPLTDVYFATLHLFPLGSELSRTLTRRVAASCLLRTEFAAICEHSDARVATQCADLCDQAVTTVATPGNPYAAQASTDEQPDWSRIRAAAHITAYVTGDMRALRPTQRSTRTRPKSSVASGNMSTPTDGDDEIQDQRAALIRLEAALRSRSGRITDNNGAAIDKSLARDALLRTSLQLRYLLRVVGATQRGVI